MRSNPFESAGVAESGRVERCICFLFVVGLAFFVLLVGSVRGESLPAPDEQTSSDGIRRYLQSLAPSAATVQERQRRIESLVRQLGDTDFRTREQAFAELTLIGIPGNETLRDAAKSKDPEVSWRASLVLKRVVSRDRGDTVPGRVEAVAELIRSRKIGGLVSALLSVSEWVDDSKTMAAISRAVLATVHESDLKEIEKALDHPKWRIRLMTLKAMIQLRESSAIVNRLEAAMDDDEELVQVEAAQALANVGYRTVIPKLISLLESDETQVRFQASQILRALTKQEFEFTSYASQEKRSAVIEKWKQWNDASGENAELFFPLVLEKPFLGRILIADYGRDRITEVDTEGKKTWSKTVKHVWDCEGLPNGHRVASSYSGKFIVEFDTKGAEVWRQSGLPGNAMGIDRLENGNTLVACSEARLVIEYTMDHKIAWQAKTPGRAVDVQRLENGNTLVALESGGNRVVELDPDGDVVWSISIKSPLTAERLENGNTLAASANENRAAEFGRDGELVWERKVGEKTTVSRRLPSGETLIGTHTSVKLFRPDGEVLWSQSGFKHCYGAQPY